MFSLGDSMGDDTDFSFNFKLDRGLDTDLNEVCSINFIDFIISKMHEITTFKIRNLIFTRTAVWNMYKLNSVLNIFFCLIRTIDIDIDSRLDFW